MNRRNVLGRLLGCALLPAVGALSACFPGVAFARQQGAFDAKTPRETIEKLFNALQPEPTKQVRIVAPDIAENGTVVPITIESDLSGVESVAVLARDNPRALAAVAKIGKRTAFPLSLRVKLAKSQDVQVLVLAQGKLYTASRPVRVSVGGCGG
ncbi:MAG: hypothetical protein H6R10_3353 [Rhodocyclaceae bacterium]|nr:hypothetical protein [Rhodocyclaceae bacterium]